MEWNGDKQWWLGEHSIELMVPLDFIDTRPCFPQQDIFLWGYAEWSLVFKYFGTFGKIVGSASLVNSHFPRSSRTVDYRLKILFYLLTYLKIKHIHRFSTFQTCTNLFQSVQPTGCYCCLAARISSGIYIRYFSIKIRWKGRTGIYRIQINPLPHKIRWKGRTGFYRIQINPLPHKFIWSITE
jgi:hypothetical protein